MDRLSAMRIFVAVVEAKSFSGAAQSLGLAKATVTAAVKNLEQHLGTALLNRTTRYVSITAEGQLYVERAKAILSEVDEAETLVSSNRAAAKGQLTIEVPAAIGRAFIVPHLQRFTAQHPDLKVVMLLNPDPGGLVQSGVDVALQFGELKDSNYIARKVLDTRHVVCASPGYLARAGRPRHPRDLQRFNCLGYYNPRRGRVSEWLLRRGADTLPHKPTGSLHFNRTQSLIEMAVGGAGVICVPDILVRDAIAHGELVPLLEAWQTQPRPLYLVYPPHRYLPQKVRAFSSFVLDLWGQKPAAPAEA